MVEEVRKRCTIPYSYVKFNPHTNAHQINSHTVMLLNLLSGLLAAVTPTVTG